MSLRSNRPEFPDGGVPPDAEGLTPDPSRLPSRRHFVIGGAVAAAAAIAGRTGIDLSRPRSTGRLPAATTPDEALNRLLEGNRRFVDQRLESINEDLDILRQKTADKQQPFAAVLSCADSRVPAEMIFDQTIGHIFVTRVAGNVASAEIIASLEYGVAVLGTAVILVIGHSACGAVKATIAGQAVPGQISTLYRLIRPAVDQAGNDLEGAIKANARIQAKLLRDSSPVIADYITKGSLKVAAAYYQLSTGQVTVLE